jgi:hypothetical protein
MKTDKQIEQEMINDFFDKIWAEKVEAAEELIKSDKYKTEGIIILCCYIGAISYERYIMSNPKTTDRDAYKNILLKYSGLDSYQKFDLLFFYKWHRSEYNNHNSYNYFRKNNYENYRKIKKIIEKKFGPKKDINSQNRFIAEKEILNVLDTASLNKKDIAEMKKRLELFSVSEIFYRYYRCAGVHKGDVLIDLNPYLPITIDQMLQTIKNVLSNLKAECVSSGKWPWEL